MQFQHTWCFQFQIVKQAVIARTYDTRTLVRNWDPTKSLLRFGAGAHSQSRFAAIYWCRRRCQRQLNPICRAKWLVFITFPT